MTTEPFDALVARVRDLAAAAFEKARGSHAWDHTLRVVHLCEHIPCCF